MTWNSDLFGTVDSKVQQGWEILGKTLFLQIFLSVKLHWSPLRQKFPNFFPTLPFSVIPGFTASPCMDVRESILNSPSFSFSRFLFCRPSFWSGHPSWAWLSSVYKLPNPSLRDSLSSYLWPLPEAGHPIPCLCLNLLSRGSSVVGKDHLLFKNTFIFSYHTAGTCEL